MLSLAKTASPAARISRKAKRLASTAPWPILQASSEQRPAPCACGGGCPRCRANAPVQRKLAIGEPDDPLERQADQIADSVMRMPDDEHRTSASNPVVQRACTKCDEEENEKLQAKPAATARTEAGNAPGIVDEVLRSSGEPLDREARAFLEPRFGQDFGQVRVHADARAAESAHAVNALAYTVGRDIVFASGRYAPQTDAGRALLAHELAHTVQQADAAHLRRTPASKVSCANSTPLHVPGLAPVDIADPVGVITAAEDRANQMIDDVIGELDFTRQRIIAGEPAAWPTISDAIAQGLRLMGLDPDDPAIWTAPSGTGERSVPLLLRRLRLIRGTIGSGSFFFFCLGTGMTRLGTCAPPAGDPDICTGAVAATCSGQFFTAFCPTFWTNAAEDQAARIIHESAHNFAAFIGHTGRFTNAECFARLVQNFAGVPEADQRVDLCPNP